MGEDVVDELRKVLLRASGDMFCLLPKEVIEKAIERIEFLRLHAGAITEGETFDDIAKRTPRRIGDVPCKTSG
jgi:hypothetical protein